jgi:hypothetical protein
VGRNQIANRLEVTVNSLQITCSRLVISLRKRSLANDGAVAPIGVVQRSVKRIEQDNIAARARFTLLLKSQNRQKAIDLHLHGGLIEELALETAKTSSIYRDHPSQVVRKNLVGDLLRNGESALANYLVRHAAARAGRHIPFRHETR